jgi:hypothetical protein
MLLIKQRIIDSCFSKFERKVRHNTRLKKKTSFFPSVFKEKKKMLTNGYKNSRWQR